MDSRLFQKWLSGVDRLDAGRRREPETVPEGGAVPFGFACRHRGWG